MASGLPESNPTGGSYAAETNTKRVQPVELTFQITLEHVDGNDRFYIFRLAPKSSSDRFLLPYPEVAGLHFTTPTGGELAEWKTRILASTRLDEFILNPDARIAFDLKSHIIEPDRVNGN